LAFLAEGNHQAQSCCDIFNNIFGYLRTSGATLASGETTQIDDDIYFRFRKPKEDEYFLESDGELLVAEAIFSNQFNR
jgi:hypothetical protein